VLDLDGSPKEIIARTESREADVTIGADGFSYTRRGEDSVGFKLGSQA
jgi:hypothetical protein